jgi:hypothetical protein
MRRKSRSSVFAVDLGSQGADDASRMFSATSYYAWGGMFSERGYTAVEIDIDAPEQSTSNKESLQVMAKGQSCRSHARPHP